jgi:hypothetical protein
MVFSIRRGHLVLNAVRVNLNAIKEEQIMTEKSKPKINYNDDLSFITCPTHNIKYPKGASCPLCKKG